MEAIVTRSRLSLLELGRESRSRRFIFGRGRETILELRERVFTSICSSSSSSSLFESCVSSRAARHAC